MALENILLPPELEEYMTLTDAPREIMVGAYLCFASSLVSDVSVVSNACHATYSRPMKLNLFGAMVGESSIGKSVAMRAPLDVSAMIREERRAWYEEHRFHNFAVDNITTAYLASYAAEYRSAMILKDEMASMFEALDFAKSSYGLTTDDLCSLFSQVPINKGTKTDGDENIQNLYVGLFGGLQPKFAYPFIKEEKYLAQGFLQRFLFFYPEVSAKELTEEDALKDIVDEMYSNEGRDIKNAYDRVVGYFKNLSDNYNKTMQGVERDQVKASEIRIFTRRNPSTKGADIEYLAKIKSGRANDKYKYSMWSKKFEIANRISALLCVMHNTDEKKLEKDAVVPDFFFEQAIEIVEYSMEGLERLKREMEGEADEKLLDGHQGKIMRCLYDLHRANQEGQHNQSSLHRYMSDSKLIDVGASRFSQVCKDLINNGTIRVEKRKLYLNTDALDFASIFGKKEPELDFSI
jgi:hypothetical protein